MNNRDIDNKVSKAFRSVTPDILDSILSDCATEKGTVITMTESKRKNIWIKSIAAAAAVLVLAFAGIGGAQYYKNNTVNATVSLDVNPSIEIEINHNEKVLDVDPLNEDAKIVLGKMKLEGSNLETAVNAIVGSMVRNGYLSELQNSILLTVDSKNDKTAAELEAKLVADINSTLTADGFAGAVYSQTAEKTTGNSELAKNYGITRGKAQLISKIIEKDPFYTFESLVSLSINELGLLMSDTGSTPDGLNQVGNSSECAYIGKDKAKEIALGKAGLTEDQVTAMRVHIDFDDGRAEYEVEFKADKTEYECDINALTGEIITFEKEPSTADAVITPDQTTPVTPDTPKDPLLPSEIITKEAAWTAALEKAGLPSGAQINNKKIELDFDNGKYEYEIEFRCSGFEYDVTVNAETGAIIEFDKEADDDYRPGNQGNAGQGNGNQGAGNQSGSGQGLGNQGNTTVVPPTPAEPSEPITRDEAVALALSKAGLESGDVRELECELDTDRGIKKYEVEFKKGNWEYEIEINAETGEIIKYDRDLDD